MSTVRTMYKKIVFGLSFLLRQGQDFLLEIHNHSRHTSSSRTRSVMILGRSFRPPLHTQQKLESK